MNDAEQDMRIIELEKRVTRLAEASSGEWRSLEDLSRRLIALAHRVHILEQNTKIAQEVTDD